MRFNPFKRDDSAAEGLAAMALANALLAVMLHNNACTPAEAFKAVAHMREHLRQVFPNHRGHEKAVRILESVLAGLLAQHHVQTREGAQS